MHEEQVKKLRNMASQMRVRALDMAICACEQGRRVHFGGALSCMEIFAVLYGNVLKFDVNKPKWKGRDYFFADKAHCILAQYTALSMVGMIDDVELDNYLVDGGPLTGYAMDIDRGLEYSGGSLGMAFSYAAGVAWEFNKKRTENRVYILVGDGECDEGVLWETAMFAAHYQLDNLVLIVDRNHLQLDGDTEEVMKLHSLEGKFNSFGWNVRSVNGHSVSELLDAFSYKPQGVPYVVIADTVKGKGASYMENKKEWHQNVISREQYELAMKELKEKGKANA